MPEGLTIIHKQCGEYCIETDVICSLETYNKKMKVLSDSFVQMSQAEFMIFNEAICAAGRPANIMREETA